MTSARPDMQQRGYSLLELLLMLGAMLLLMSVALNYYALYQQDAEDTATRQVLDSLRTALALKAASIAQHEGESHVDRLVGINPFDILEQRPPNYLGAYPGSTDARVLGAWYHDARRLRVVYVERWHDGKSLDSAGPERTYRIRRVPNAGGPDAIRLDPIPEERP